MIKNLGDLNVGDYFEGEFFVGEPAILKVVRKEGNVYLLKCEKEMKAGCHEMYSCPFPDEGKEFRDECIKKPCFYFCTWINPKKQVQIPKLKLALEGKDLF